MLFDKFQNSDGGEGLGDRGDAEWVIRSRLYAALVVKGSAGGGPVQPLPA